jgi:putative transposase
MNLAAWPKRNRVARVTAWATAELMPADKVVTEVGSAVNGHRHQFFALLPGARARRRGLSNAALGTLCRHLSYQRGWYGSQLVVADRWFPSSKTCHVCGHVQDIGWDEKWQCGSCSVTHQRDDNAAINLARYEDTISVVGPVGAAVKRVADCETGPCPAGGCEARKGRSRRAAEQPRDRVRVA